MLRACIIPGIYVRYDWTFPALEVVNPDNGCLVGLIGPGVIIGYGIDDTFHVHPFIFFKGSYAFMLSQDTSNQCIRCAAGQQHPGNEKCAFIKMILPVNKTVKGNPLALVFIQVVFYLILFKVKEDIVNDQHIVLQVINPLQVTGIEKGEAFPLFWSGYVDSPDHRNLFGDPFGGSGGTQKKWQDKHEIPQLYRSFGLKCDALNLKNRQHKEEKHG